MNDFERKNSNTDSNYRLIKANNATSYDDNSEEFRDLQAEANNNNNHDEEEQFYRNLNNIELMTILESATTTATPQKSSLDSNVTAPSSSSHVSPLLTSEGAPPSSTPPTTAAALSMIMMDNLQNTYHNDDDSNNQQQLPNYPASSATEVAATTLAYPRFHNWPILQEVNDNNGYYDDDSDVISDDTNIMNRDTQELSQQKKWPLLGFNGPRRRRRIKWCKIPQYLWSLSFLLIVICLTLLILSAGSVWIVNFLVNKHGVNTVSRQDRINVVFRIANHMTAFLNDGPMKLQSLLYRFKTWENVIGFPIGNSTYPGARDLQVSFFSSYLNTSYIDGIYYGTETNSYTSVLRDSFIRDENAFTLVLADTSVNSSAMRIYPVPRTTFEPSFGDVQYRPTFLPTTRSWYSIVRNNPGRMMWTPAYASNSTPTIRFPMSTTFMDANGNMRGVLTVDFNLKSISLFLALLTRNSNSIIFIVEPSLNIIGTSVGETVQVTPSATLRQSALNHSSPEVKGAAQHIAQKFGVPFRLNHLNVVEFEFMDSRGREFIADLKALRDSYGLDWIVVSIIESAVVYRSVTHSNQISLSISAVLLLAALVFSILIGCTISRTLSHVSMRMKLIANMDFSKEKAVRSSRLYELDRIVKSVEQTQKSLNSFELFVPSDVVQELVKQKKTAQLGVSQVELTTVFIHLHSDIDGFFDRVSPVVLIDILQLYFTEISAILSKRKGVVDKYMEGCIMALFNAPVPVKDHALCAVAAARDIVRKMVKLNQIWAGKGYPKLCITAGINTAKCFVGNIGSRDRVSYTALGDGVNVASRLGLLNQRYGTGIIIGPGTYEKVKERYICRWITRVLVKGKHQPLDIYQPLNDWRKARDIDLRLHYAHDNLKHMIEQNRLSEAREEVDMLKKEQPNDLVVEELRSRLNQPLFDSVLKLFDK